MSDEDKKPEEPIVIFECGPSQGPCVCECLTGGPCGHIFDGPEEVGENYNSATCSKCGMSAITHALWTAP